MTKPYTAKQVAEIASWNRESRERAAKAEAPLKALEAKVWAVHEDADHFEQDGAFFVAADLDVPASDLVVIGKGATIAAAWTDAARNVKAGR